MKLKLFFEPQIGYSARVFRIHRDICFTDTKVTFTPTHCLTIVWYIWQGKSTESVASCPVRSETDLCGNQAVNDSTGAQPVSVVHVCVDGRFSSLLNLHAVSG